MHSSGKRCVTIYNSEHVLKTVAVYILVAKAYIPIPTSLIDCGKRLVVNHLKPSRPSNDSVENLEWTTDSGNVIHAHQHGLNKNTRPVIQLNEDGEEVARYYSMAEAARQLGVKKWKVEKSLREDRYIDGRKFIKSLR